MQDNRQGLRETHVVTSFLRRTDESDERILIVQRSQRVGSYRAQWGGISGFVEEGVTPREQAYTEIREETGLQADQVRLLRQGQTVEVANPEVHRYFIVHPFLFEVKTPAEIKIDWEAVEMRWVTPSELKNYPTVPKLYEAYLSALNGEEVEKS